MDVGGGALSSLVGFPYESPAAGQHRIVIQMKQGNTVETGVFNADVREARP
jgi:hypothetical protein